MTILVDPISSSERYFSAAKLRAWGRFHLKDRYSISALARVLGWSETATRSILRENTSPTLEGYLRALARVGEPVGSWLDHVSAKIGD